MGSAVLCFAAALLPLPAIIVSVSWTAVALPARPMSCAVVVTPSWALRPHKSCPAETHGHIRPLTALTYCARVSLVTLSLAPPRQDRASRV
jgi:hypothetical protein